MHILINQSKTSSQYLCLQVVYRKGGHMKDKDICVYRKTINGELMCIIVKKPISKKCGGCDKSCPNFEKED